MASWGKSPRFDARGILPCDWEKASGPNGGNVASIVFRQPPDQFYWESDFQGKPIASPRTPRPQKKLSNLPKLNIPKFALELLPNYQSRTSRPNRTPRRGGTTTPRAPATDRRERARQEVAQAKKEIKQQEEAEKSFPADIEYINFIHDVLKKKHTGEDPAEAAATAAATAAKDTEANATETEPIKAVSADQKQQACKTSSKEGSRRPSQTSNNPTPPPGASVDEPEEPSEIDDSPAYLQCDAYDRCKKLLGMKIEYDIKDQLTARRDRTARAQGRRPQAMARSDPVVYYDEQAFFNRYLETKQLREAIRTSGRR